MGRGGGGTPWVAVGAPEGVARGGGAIFRNSEIFENGGVHLRKHEKLSAFGRELA